MTPLVSIVLPTRDGSRFLAEAIESCLAQTLPAWELIVVDDGSVDDTPAIVDRYRSRDPRIRAVRNVRTPGLPGALNTGFAVAQGAYHTWTSDDNLYSREALATMAAFLDDHPGVDAVYADYVRINRNGEETSRTRVGAPEEIYFGNCVGPCFLYRRSMGEQLGGYNEDLFLAEDFDFWLRASAEFSLRPLRTALYVYREHAESLTNRRARAVIKATERALRKFYAAHAAPACSVRARSWLRLASQARAGGEGRLATKYVVYAARYSAGTTFRRAESVLAFRGELEEAGRRLAAKEREIGALRRTWSWRLTAPLRGIKALLVGRPDRG